MKIHLHFTLLASVFISLIACQPVKVDVNKPGNAACMVTEQRDGYTMKSYLNNDGKIEVIVMTGDSASFVITPYKAFTRDVNISDDLYNCLKKCKKPDGSYDTDCIIRCPASVRYHVYYTY